MKAIIPILLLCMTAPAICISQTQANELCSPASYRGLVVGKSTRADVLRTLGKPEALSHEEDTGTPYWSYTVAGPRPGWLMVFTRKKLLTGIRLVFKTPLSKKETIGLYGPELHTVHYDFDNCASGGGAGPVHVSAGGPIERWEYRGEGKGIIFSVHDGQAQEMAFVCGPEDASQPKCDARLGSANPPSGTRQGRN
jgi:hypothetical protein